MENKKAQQMTLGTIIAIVLGLVVLVFLIYGFSTGWGNLWEKVTGLGGGDVNVATISTACMLACQQDDQQSFCVQKRKVVLDADGKTLSETCRQLTSGGIVDACQGLDANKICIDAATAEDKKGDCEAAEDSGATCASGKVTKYVCERAKDCGWTVAE